MKEVVGINSAQTLPQSEINILLIGPIDNLSENAAEGPNNRQKNRSVSVDHERLI